MIAGGGVMGCALAYQLARRGRQVVLLERETLGSQSTARCAGGIRQQFSSETNVRLQQLAVRMLLDFETEVGAPSGFRQIGYLFVLSKPELLLEFRANLELWGRCGLDEARWVEPAEIGELAPILSLEGILGGTFCPTDGLAGPADVTTGYAGAARRAGAGLREGVEVTGLEVAGGRLRSVRTSAGEIATELFFDCAGPWSEAVGRLAGIEVPVKPYRRHVIVSDSFPAVRRDHPFVVDFATSFYFHPEGDGVLFGMSDREEPSSFETDVDWGFLEKIVEEASRRAPALQSAGLRTAWAGLYETTPDHQAILGAAEGLEGFWCACGFSGHGFMQAPAAGLVVAQMACGETPSVDVSAFAHSRFGRRRLVRERNVI